MADYFIAASSFSKNMIVVAFDVASQGDVAFMPVRGNTYVHVNQVESDVIAMADLKDPDGNDAVLSSCNPEDLVFDRRPIKCDKNGYIFDITLQGEEFSFTPIGQNGGWIVWDQIFFRMYNKTEEEVPDFGSFYTYLGVQHERAPCETVEATIHPSLDTVKENAFDSCSMMKRCEMKDTVGDIKEEAFFGCESLRTLRLSQILKRIGEDAFNECIALEILVIPSTATGIGQGAFECMKKIKVLALHHTTNLDNIHDDVFDGCDNLQLAKPHGIGMKQWLKQRYLNLPLHTVCYNINVTSQDIQRCIQQHPESPSQQDDAGMTALHIVSMLAMAGHGDVEVVFLMVYNANPAALFIHDIYGASPLDYLKEQDDMMRLIVLLMQDLCVNRIFKEVNVKQNRKRKYNNNKEE